MWVRLAALCSSTDYQLHVSKHHSRDPHRSKSYKLLQHSVFVMLQLAKVEHPAHLLLIIWLLKSLLCAAFFLKLKYSETLETAQLCQQI